MRASRFYLTLIGLAIFTVDPLAATAAGPFELVRGREPSDLRAVWGSSASDVFVAGYGGEDFLHYDGSTWTRLPKPASCKDNQAGWGVDSLWGASGTDVFGVGGNVIMHYDGLAWSEMALPPQYENGQRGLLLFEVWGSSGSDVYAVGYRQGDGLPGTVGVVLHYDGSVWAELAVPQPGPGNYFPTVWGSSRSDVFVGGRGTILHYDGTTWSTSRSDPGTDFTKIRGLSATDVLAIGMQGQTSVLLRFDGSSWSPVTDPGVSPNPMFAGDGGGSIFLKKLYQAVPGNMVRYDGSSFSEMSEPGPGVVWGSSATDLFGTNGSSIYRHDGTAWVVVANMAGFGEAWGSSARDIFAIGDGIMHFDGAYWSPMQTPVRSDLHDIWGSSASDVFVVGGKLGLGAALHYDGAAWSRMILPPGSTPRAVWGAAANEVFAVGQMLNETCVEGHCYSGPGLILRYDGTDWSPMTLPGTVTGVWDVWGVSGNDVFAVGSAGDASTVLHYDGTSWSTMATPATEGLIGIWGNSASDVYAVGQFGAILHYDGTAWTEVEYDVMIPSFDPGTGEWTEVSAHDRLNSKIWGTSSSDVYVFNGDDAILHFDGAAWSLVPVPCITDRSCWGYFYGIWGSSANDLYVFAGWSTILHYGVPGPSGLSASDGLPGGSVSLSWSDVEGESGYQVHRSLHGVFDFTMIAAVGANATAYDDPLGCGSRGYDYKVAAVYADGSLSAFSPADVGFSGGCAPPTVVTLVSPAGLTWSTTPAYTWNAQPGVASYHLWVGTGTTPVLSAWYTAEQAGCASGAGPCSVTPATPLADGRWEFTVQGGNDQGTGPWSTAKVFDISTTPTALTLYFPYSEYRVMTWSYPGFEWKAQPGVDSYQLWVGTGSSTAHSAWYTAADADCESGMGRCYVSVSQLLAEGTWYYNVRGRNAAGTGPWTTSRKFSVGVPPPAPTLLSPSGTIGTAVPTFQWSAVAGADGYQLWVGTGADTAALRLVTLAAAGCGTGTGTCSVTLSDALAPGSWFFNVKAENAAGFGPWAAPLRFTYAPAGAPTQLTLLAPSGAAGTSAPTFSWSARAGVDSYQLWVGTATSTAYSVWYTPATAGCGSGETTCSATPGTALAAGGWYFNVRGRNLAGTGPWTTAKGFSTP